MRITNPLKLPHPQSLVETLKVQPENAGWWISLAYAVRRAESVEKAEAILLRAQAIHPQFAVIAFNLACYASVTGRFEEAKTRLQHAIDLDKDIREMALDDEDLRPLWIGLVTYISHPEDGDNHPTACPLKFYTGMNGNSDSMSRPPQRGDQQGSVDGATNQLVAMFARIYAEASPDDQLALRAWMRDIILGRKGGV